MTFGIGSVEMPTGLRELERAVTFRQRWPCAPEAHPNRPWKPPLPLISGGFFFWGSGRMGESGKLLAEWFWVDRWAGSSARGLPLEARGLYREMLSESWRRGGALPKDPEQIRRIVGASEREWNRSWPLVKRYWIDAIGGLEIVNETQLIVYAEARERQASFAERGRKGGLAKHVAKLQAKPQAKPQAKLVAKGVLKQQPPISYLQSPCLPTVDPPLPPLGAVPSTATVNAFGPDELAALYLEVLPELPKVRLPLSAGIRRAAVKALRDEPDRATWHDRLSRAALSRFLKGDNDRGWRACLEWILNARNAAKIDSGAYDGGQAQTPTAARFNRVMGIVNDLKERNASNGHLAIDSESPF